jgi:signal transduction histidine kinase
MIKNFLRRLQLFAGLPEADLDWLSDQAEPFSLEAGEVLIREGELGDAAFIVLEGELEVKKKSDMQDIFITLREPGEVIGEMALLDHSPRNATVTALQSSRLLKIRGDTFQQLLSQKPSAALAILHTVSQRLHQNEALLRQNEKMVALGTLAAGLAHELNNPTAAVGRSVDHLRSAVAGWMEASIDLDRYDLTPAQLQLVNELKSKIENFPAEGSAPDPLILNDREISIQSWLEQLGVEQAWEMAPRLASSGWELEALRDLEASFNPQVLRPVVKWLGAGGLVYALLNETHVGSERISEIVKAVKDYSYLDQAPVQEVDVQKGLENTLIILRYKITKRGIKVIRSYADYLPPIEAHGSELNQVWTNIIDNAVGAMDSGGELTLRTYSTDANIVVEIEDTGKGIPAEIQNRIFEPFYTTKPPGMGTGLGLHIAHTIVYNHHGQIQFTSRPGKTCFQVTLPKQLPH